MEVDVKVDVKVKLNTIETVAVAKAADEIVKSVAAAIQEILNGKSSPIR